MYVKCDNIQENRFETIFNPFWLKPLSFQFTRWLKPTAMNKETMGETFYSLPSHLLSKKGKRGGRP